MSSTFNGKDIVPSQTDGPLRKVDGDLGSKQTLKLTLSKKPFEVMITGEKRKNLGK